MLIHRSNNRIEQLDSSGDIWLQLSRRNWTCCPGHGRYTIPFDNYIRSVPAVEWEVFRISSHWGYAPNHYFSNLLVSHVSRRQDALTRYPNASVLIGRPVPGSCPFVFVGLVWDIPSAISTCDNSENIPFSIWRPENATCHHIHVHLFYPL